MSSTNFSSEIYKHPELNEDVISLIYSDPNDSSRNIQVGILPKFGSNVIQYRVGENDIFYFDPKSLNGRDLWTGNFVLWPLPNRVRNKEYDFEGEKVSLTDIKRKQGNDVLIHGLVDDQEFQYEEPLISEDSASVKTFIEISKENPLFKYYPYESKLTLNFVITKDGLKIEYTVENKSDKNIPFGFAFHPYFNTFSKPDSTFVSIPAKYLMQADEELLPTGVLHDVSGLMYKMFDLSKPKNVNCLELDHVYTGMLDGENVYVMYPDLNLNVNLMTSEEFTHTVLFTLAPNKPFICLEPQVGSTDAINLHTIAERDDNEELKKAASLMILDGDKTHTGFIEYRLEFI